MRSLVGAVVALLLLAALYKPCVAQSDIAGIAWFDQGQNLMIIHENGEISYQGWYVGSFFKWIIRQGMTLGNFWHTSSDSVHVDARIVGFDFEEFESPPPTTTLGRLFRPGTCIVLLEDGRWFTRPAVQDSLGFRLVDQVPEELSEMRLER